MSSDFEVYPYSRDDPVVQPCRRAQRRGDACHHSQLTHRIPLLLFLSAAETTYHKKIDISHGSSHNQIMKAIVMKKHTTLKSRIIDRNPA